MENEIKCLSAAEQDVYLPGGKMKARAYIVDDDPLTANLLEAELAQAGFETDYFETGEKALKMISTQRPDIILSDLTAADKDGHSLCRRLRLNPDTANIPLLILSGGKDIDDLAETLPLNADDYIRKPFQMRDLIARVDAVINRVGTSDEVDTESGIPQPPEATGQDVETITKALEAEAKSGELTIARTDGQKIGRLFYKNGRLINAQFGTLVGEEAFYDLLWEKQTVCDFIEKKIDIPREIDLSNAVILYKGACMIERSHAFFQRAVDIDRPMKRGCRQSIPPDVEAEVGEETLHTVLSQIDQDLTIRHIIDNANMSRCRISSILWLMLDSGVISLENEPLTSESAPMTGHEISTEPDDTMDVISTPSIDARLIDVITSLEKGNFTGALEVGNSMHTPRCCIYFQKGAIIHSVHGICMGKKALYRIFSERDIAFNINPRFVAVNRTIREPVSTLLREGSREIQALTRVKPDTLESVVTVVTQPAQQIVGRPDRTATAYVLSLAEQHGNIRDILNASLMTDFQTYKHLFYLVKKGALKVIARIQPHIRLVTDGGNDLPEELIQKRQITVINLPPGLDKNGDTRKNPYTYKSTAPSGTFHTRSRMMVSPTEKDIHSAFSNLVDSEDILAIFNSSKISGAFYRAVLARHKYFNEYSVSRQRKSGKKSALQLEIIDSRLASIGMGMLILEASDKIKQGWQIREIRDYMEKLIPKIRMFFSVNTRQEGVTLGRPRSILSYLFDTREIFGIWNGELFLADCVRGEKNAFQCILHWIEQGLESTKTPINTGVMHIDAPAAVNRIRSQLTHRFTIHSMVTSHVRSSAGTLFGSGTIGVAYYPAETD